MVQVHIDFFFTERMHLRSSKRLAKTCLSLEERALLILWLNCISITNSHSGYYDTRFGGNEQVKGGGLFIALNS